jgi:PAS domain S-box-containing protein
VTSDTAKDAGTRRIAELEEALRLETAARLEAERSSDEWRNRYDAAVMAAGHVFYDWDTRTDAMSWGGGCEAALGWTPDELAEGGLARTIELIHPDDREAFRRELERVEAARESFHMEYRFHHKDGHWVIVQDDGSFFFDDGGEPIRMLGFLVDMTERKATEAALLGQTAALDAVIESIPDAVYVGTATGIVRCNRRGLEMLGLDSVEQLNHPVPELAAMIQVRDARTGEPLPLEEQAFVRALAGERTIRDVLVRNAKTGRDMALRSAAAPIRLGDVLLGAVAINTDVTQASEDRRRLLESELRLRLAVEAADLGTWVIDPETGSVVASARCKAMLGLAPDAPLGINAKLELIHPEHRASVAAALKRACDPHGDGLFDMEFRALWPDGSVRWIASRGRSQFSEAGGVRKAVRIDGTVRDVTRRRRADEHQQTLLAELSHRVKNTLAIVQAIASQTLRRSSTMDDFVQSFTGRLGALSRAHSLLTDQNWEAAYLPDLVAQTLAPYRANGTAIRLDLQPVALNPAGAVALAMVFHELTTNAAKHGALSDASGALSVECGSEIWPAGRRLVARWEETTARRDDPPTGRGFGMTLIERTIVGQLEGGIEFDWRPNGLSCRMWLPWEAVAGP